MVSHSNLLIYFGVTCFAVSTIKKTGPANCPISILEVASSILGPATYFSWRFGHEILVNRLGSLPRIILTD